MPEQNSHFLRAAPAGRIETLRNEEDDGSCEKYYFSFRFSVLDHR